MNNGTTYKEFPSMPNECPIMGKGTETNVQSALTALNTCKYCFSLMEEPQNNLFKFLKYLHISEAFNAHTLRILRQLIKTASASAQTEKATFLKTCSLLQANVHLYALMQDKETNVFKFLDSVKSASSNTRKAMKYLNDLQKD